MHPAISRFPNSKFYQKKIINAPNVKDKSYERSYLPGRMFGPYSFINILDGKEEKVDFSHSRRNMVEVAVTVKIVKKLYKGNGFFQLFMSHQLFVICLGRNWYAYMSTVYFPLLYLYPYFT